MSITEYTSRQLATALDDHYIQEMTVWTGTLSDPTCWLGEIWYSTRDNTAIFTVIIRI